MKVVGILKIKSNQSGKILEFPANVAYFNIAGNYERSMSPEALYVWNHKTRVSGEAVEIEYKVSEYPVGAYNYHSIKAPGFTVIEEYTFNFFDEPLLEEGTGYDPNNIDLDFDLDNI